MAKIYVSQVLKKVTENMCTNVPSFLSATKHFMFFLQSIQKNNSIIMLRNKLIIFYLKTQSNRYQIQISYRKKYLQLKVKSKNVQIIICQSLCKVVYQLRMYANTYDYLKDDNRYSYLTVTTRTKLTYIYILKIHIKPGCY